MNERELDLHYLELALEEETGGKAPPDLLPSILAASRASGPHAAQLHVPDGGITPPGAPEPRAMPDDARNGSLARPRLPHWRRLATGGIAAALLTSIAIAYVSNRSYEHGRKLSDARPSGEATGDEARTFAPQHNAAPHHNAPPVPIPGPVKPEVSPQSAPLGPVEPTQPPVQPAPVGPAPVEPTPVSPQSPPDPVPLVPALTKPRILASPGARYRDTGDAIVLESGWLYVSTPRHVVVLGCEMVHEVRGALIVSAGAMPDATARRDIIRQLSKDAELDGRAFLDRLDDADNWHRQSGVAACMLWGSARIEGTLIRAGEQ